MPNLLAELNEQQRQVVQAVHGPVLVLAGAGSGKTRALTYRIAYMLERGLAQPEEILAVTFTNKAAREMQERVAGLMQASMNGRPTIGTFHSLGATMLRNHASYLPRTRGFTIFDADDSKRLIRLVMDDLHMSRKEHSPAQFAFRISSAKNAMMGPAEVAARGGRDDELTAQVFARYEKLLGRNDAYDFDDLLIRPIELLERQASVRTLYQRRWRWLSVDEYQDTNPPQDRLLQLLIGPERNLCVVGDDYQAIYSWRGARVDHILQFERLYPDCTTVYLTRNYRSTPRILTAANQVIAENRNQKHKKLWTSKTSGEPVSVTSLSSSKHEARWVREAIEQYVDGGGARRDCVVLYRTNAQSRALEEEFLTFGVPYTIVGGFRFYERREVKDAIAFLRLWMNGSSVLALHRIADALWRGVGPKTIARWEAAAEKQDVSVVSLLDDKKVGATEATLAAYASARERSFETVSDLLHHLLKHSGYLKWLERQPDGEERLENIEELFNVTAAYADVEQFLEEVALISDLDTLEEEHDRVTCMTLHAAKGLEFPAVIIVGCEEGLLPHANSVDSRADIEEERRLLYVGMTRAQERLALSFARTRYIHGDYVPQSPSRFLKSLPDEVRWLEAGSGVEEGAEDASDDVASFLHEDTADGEPTVVAVEEGDYVRHKRFGRGVVIGLKGSIATCVFERHGVKQIDAGTVQATVEVE